MADYRLRFLFRDERLKQCQVHIKDKRRTWVGVMAHIPDQLLIWFAYNRLTGQIRRGKCLELLRWKLPVAYGRVMKNLENYAP